MAMVALSLDDQKLNHMSRAGFRLWGLRGAGSLIAGSRIEGPTSVLSIVAPGSLIEVGAFCNLSGGKIGNVRIGRYCSIADGVVIGAHEHPTNWLTTSRTAYYPEVNGWDKLLAGDRLDALHTKKPVFNASCPVTTLGADVWIGEGAFIKAGVTLGHGAIIGARATVLGDVPPYAIVVGTPARVVRLRLPEPLVERLLASQWWRYSIYDLFGAPFDRAEAALVDIERMIAEGAARPFEGQVLTAEDIARLDIAQINRAPFNGDGAVAPNRHLAAE